MQIEAMLTDPPFASILCSAHELRLAVDQVSCQHQRPRRQGAQYIGCKVAPVALLVAKLRHLLLGVAAQMDVADLHEPCKTAGRLHACSRWYAELSRGGW